MCTTCPSCLFGGKISCLLGAEHEWVRLSPPSEMSVSDQKDVDEAGRVKVLQENPIVSHICSYDSREDNASRLVHH